MEGDERVEAAFGDFVSRIPERLGIDKILLESGEEVPESIAEFRVIILQADRGGGV